jgi:DNA modification methylase
MLLSPEPPVTLLLASARALPLADETVQCVVTSPPYWNLRKYEGEQREVWGGDRDHAHEWTMREEYHNHGDSSAGAKQRSNQGAVTGRGAIADGFCACGAWYGALGLEPTPDLYVENMVEVFREVRRVLRKDGTLWLNLGDTYAGGRRGGNPTPSTSGLEGGQTSQRQSMATRGLVESRRRDDFPIPRSDLRIDGIPEKNLVGIPWRVAFALQADGWILRSDIVWHKPNPMPESVTDRPTKAHEYLFLFSKSERYYYDADAIREPHTSTLRDQAEARATRTADHNKSVPDEMRNGIRGRDKTSVDPHAGGRRQAPEPGEPGAFHSAGRNKRDVWTIPTHPYAEAHFATYPEALVEPCILSREYLAMAERRIGAVTPIAQSVEHAARVAGNKGAQLALEVL